MGMYADQQLQGALRRIAGSLGGGGGGVVLEEFPRFQFYQCLIGVFRVVAWILPSLNNSLVIFIIWIYTARI